jgi:hypothetical protein
MNKVVAKKVSDPWGYDITVNGQEIPFVSSATVVKKEGDIDKLVVEIVIVESLNGEVVILDEHSNPVQTGASGF